MLIVLMPEQLPSPELPELPLYWWRLAADGRIVSSGHDTPSLLQQTFAGETLRLLAPAAAVSLLRVDMPARRAAAIRAALPFALEEQLSQELEEVHIVAGPRREDGRLLAAVLDRRLLAGWLAMLESAGLKPEALVPLSLLFEQYRQPDQVVLLPAPWPSVEQPVLAISPDQEVQLVERQLLELWLGRRLSQLDEGQRRLLLLGAESVLQGMSVDCERQIAEPAAADMWLQPMLGRSLPLNLMTAEFARRSGGQDLTRFKPLAIAAGVLLGLAWLQLAAEGWVLERERMRLTDAIDAVFDQTLPNSTRVRPVDQFQQLLQADTSGAAGGQLGPLLHDVMLALSEREGVTLKQLRANGAELEVELQLPSYADLEAVRESLGSRPGLREELQGADSAGEAVSARLRINRGES